MPPPLPVESETESVASDKTPTKANPSIQVDDELADAVMQNADPDEDEDDDEVADDEYIVEAILDHRSDFEDGEMRYDVKWKGYEKKSDRTWETEENLQGALEVLKAYWAKLGGKPIADSKAPSKKRARQSTGRGSDTPDSTVAKKQKKGGRKSKDAASKPEGDALPGNPGFMEVGDDDWNPPKVKKDSWDDKLQSVDTIEKDDDGVLWAYLLWNDKNDDGRFYRSKAKLATCKIACPQRMLDFYEKHVVFTNNRSSFAENGDTA